MTVPGEGLVGCHPGQHQPGDGEVTRADKSCPQHSEGAVSGQKSLAVPLLHCRDMFFLFATEMMCDVHRQVRDLITHCQYKSMLWGIKGVMA